jgi:hypothetical protein
MRFTHYGSTTFIIAALSGCRDEDRQKVPRSTDSKTTEIKVSGAVTSTRRIPVHGAAENRRRFDGSLESDQSVARVSQNANEQPDKMAIDQQGNTAPSNRPPDASNSEPLTTIATIASFVAPSTQPVSSSRWTENGEFYERFFMDGEGDVAPNIARRTIPAISIPPNRVGDWVSSSFRNSMHSIALSMAETMADLESRRSAEADYMSFWLASRGPELMRRAASSCGNSPYAETGASCYNLMTLATNIPVPADRKARHVAKDIGLDRFCLDHAAELVRELTNRNPNLPVDATRAATTLTGAYRQKYTVGYAANWLAFCPNLIDGCSKEIRVMVFRQGIYRRRLDVVSRGPPLNLVTHHERALQDAFGGILADGGQVDPLLYPVASVAFSGGLDIGSGDGVVTYWYNEMSSQIFAVSGGLFEGSSNNEYVVLKEGLIAQATRDGRGEEVRSKLRSVGRFIGHVLATGRQLSSDLSLMFYARLLGKVIGFEALREYEGGIYNIFKAAHDSGIWNSDSTPLPPSIALEQWPEDVPTIEYVLDRGVSDYTTYNVVEEYKELTRGLFEVIPQSVFECGIKTTELRDMILGPRVIDLGDMFAHWSVEDFDPVEIGREVEWLKEILTEWDELHRRTFVQYVTGSPRVPSGGFRMYEFTGVRHRFSIHRSLLAIDHMPVSRNCFNRLELPNYSDKNAMRRFLLLAFEHGNVGFGLA